MTATSPRTTWSESDINDLALEVVKSARWFSVKSYGAAGDGATDDTIAVQAAINAAGAAGGVVYLPTGSYSVTNLTAPTGLKPVKILGDGPEKTFLGAVAGSTGIMLDLTYTGSAQPSIEVDSLSMHLTNARTMTALRTQNVNRSRVYNVNFKYGAIGWEHVQTAGTGPIFGDWLTFQNQSSEAIHLTGSTSVGSAGKFSNVWVSVTDNTIAMTQGILIDYFTVGWIFENVQILGNVGSSFNIHSGIVYNTAAPTGLQGAFLYFANCITDQMDTGNGLDLTNARGIWSANNFWGTNPSNSKDGIAITGGKEHFYVNDWISGRGISFASAPDKVTIGSGCRFPQTSTGGAIIMPGSNPPTNLVVSADAFFYTSITNDVGKLATACNNSWNWTRAGSYV